jgi:hypothetical protein
MTSTRAIVLPCVGGWLMAPILLASQQTPRTPTPVRLFGLAARPRPLRVRLALLLLPSRASCLRLPRRCGDGGRGGVEGAAGAAVLVRVELLVAQPLVVTVVSLPPEVALAATVLLLALALLP